jgi:hypothetical protein
VLLLKENARLEGEDLAGGNGEGFPGLGVTAEPVVFLVDNELAEAGDLDFLSGCKGILHNIKEGIHNLLGLFSLEVAVGTDVFDKVFFGHGMLFLYV